jgi:hypothetical protein
MAKKSRQDTAKVDPKRLVETRPCGPLLRVR